MARRGENIHKRKDGRWEGRYIKGRSETGKAIWGYVYAYSYVDAKSALIRKKVKAADYTVPLGAQELTISVLSELWLCRCRRYPAPYHFRSAVRNAGRQSSCRIQH